MALVTVAANTVGNWVDTVDILNIAVGVRGSSYEIQLHLGTDTHIFNAGKPYNGVTVIAKANEIRVVNSGNAELTFEVM